MVIDSPLKETDCSPPLPPFTARRPLRRNPRYVRRYLVNRWILKAEVGFEYVEGDVEWTPLNTIRYPCICFFAGFFAGMFGVGGGIVKGPLMLEMGESQERTNTGTRKGCKSRLVHTTLVVPSFVHTGIPKGPKTKRYIPDVSLWQTVFARCFLLLSSREFF